MGLTEVKASAAKMWTSLWGKASVMVAAALFAWMAGALSFAWSRAVIIYNLPTVVEAQAKDIAQYKGVVEAMKDLTTAVQSMARKSQTLLGKAKINDFDTEAVMQINQLGNASGYEEAERARVTNVSSADSPSIAVKIEGRFRSDDPEVLVRLSKQAAQKLGAGAASTIRIKIEPIASK